jgi:hypothetical protein
VNASHPAPSSAEVTCRPRISRCPLPFNPAASRAWTFTTRPPSRTFSTSAPAAANVYGPASSGDVEAARPVDASLVALGGCRLAGLVRACALGPVHPGVQRVGVGANDRRAGVPLVHVEAAV